MTNATPDNPTVSPMESEFDTVAKWTAEAAVSLGPDYAIPGACRGSGSPAALNWLIQKMQLRPHERMLDVGAGVGGPSAYARERGGVAPVLVEPMPGACRAAQTLFGLPVLVGHAQALPISSSSVSAAWSLGVLCTTADKTALLEETRRVLRARGRLGLLVFVRTVASLPEQPAGNSFPTWPELEALLRHTGFGLTDQVEVDTLEPAPADWDAKGRAVDALIRNRHALDPRWRTADDQAGAMGRLLATGHVTAIALTARLE